MAHDQPITFRDAAEDDLYAIVELLSDDILGATRERLEDPLPDHYVAAFRALERQPGSRLIVAVDSGDQVVGCLQLTITHGLAHRGMTKATIEAVRIKCECRNARIGERLVRFAIDEARQARCGVVQLTTDRRRGDAHRFYERLGFEPTHIGMKLKL